MAEVEDCHGAGAIETEESSKAGSVSMKVHGARTTEMKDGHWADYTALIAASPRDPNCAQFNPALGL